LKAAVLYGQKDIRYEEVETPDIGEVFKNFTIPVKVKGKLWRYEDLPLVNIHLRQ